MLFGKIESWYFVIAQEAFPHLFFFALYNSKEYSSDKAVENVVVGIQHDQIPQKGDDALIDKTIVSIW